MTHVRVGDERSHVRSRSPVLQARQDISEFALKPFAVLTACRFNTIAGGRASGKDATYPSASW